MTTFVSLEQKEEYMLLETVQSIQRIIYLQLQLWPSNRQFTWQNASTNTTLTLMCWMKVIVMRKYLCLDLWCLHLCRLMLSASLTNCYVRVHPNSNTRTEELWLVWALVVGSQTLSRLIFRPRRQPWVDMLVLSFGARPICQNSLVYRIPYWYPCFGFGLLCLAATSVDFNGGLSHDWLLLQWNILW